MPAARPDSTTPGWKVNTWRTSSSGKLATRSPATVEPDVTLSRGTIGFAAASTVTGPIATADWVSLTFTVRVKPPCTRTPGTSAAV